MIDSIQEWFLREPQPRKELTDSNHVVASSTVHQLDVDYQPNEKEGHLQLPKAELTATDKLRPSDFLAFQENKKTVLVKKKVKLICQECVFVLLVIRTIPNGIG